MLVLLSDKVVYSLLKGTRFFKASCLKALSRSGASRFLFEGLLFLSFLDKYQGSGTGGQ